MLTFSLQLGTFLALAVRRCPFPHLLGVSEHTPVDSGEDYWAGPEETEFTSCWTQAAAPPPVPHFLPLRKEGLTDLQGPG